MNDFPLNFLMGMIAGFSVSVPLGPGGLFCIQRTLVKVPVRFGGRSWGSHV
jgi:hypothetical protein